MMPFLRTLWKSLLSSIDNDLLETSGFVAYTLLLAFFPFIILLISVTVLWGDPQTVQSTILSLSSHMPKEIADIIMPVIHDILSGPARGFLSFSILGVLWASTSGVEAIRHGLNKAYEKKEHRSFLALRLESVFLVLAFITCISLLSTLLLILPLMANYLPESDLISPWLTPLIGFLSRFTVPDILEHILSMILLSILFIGLYYKLPNHQKKSQKIIPGAILASILCTLISNVFSLYLNAFGDYNNVYKSLGGIIILILFLQLTSYFFLLGAQFNHELEKKSAHK